MSRPKGSKDIKPRALHKLGCKCFTCKRRRGEYIRHDKECACFVCRAKNGTWVHKTECQCCSCKNKRKESHKEKCNCWACRSKRGESKKNHNAEKCNCWTCKSHREGNSGEKNGMFGKTGIDSPNFGKHWIMSEEAKKKIGFASKNRPKEQIRRENETRRRNGWYKNPEETKKKMSGPKTNEHIANIIKAAQRRPNSFEVRSLAYLELVYTNNKFKYTGGGSLIVNGKSADAYSKELNTVALFNGIYWHLEKRGYKNTKENKEIVEKIEAQPFISAGYKIIFIWEDELTTLIRNMYPLELNIQSKMQELDLLKEKQEEFNFTYGV